MTRRAEWAELDPEGPLGLGRPPAVSVRDWGMARSYLADGRTYSEIGAENGKCAGTVIRIVFIVLRMYRQWSRCVDAALEHGDFIRLSWQTHLKQRRLEVLRQRRERRKALQEILAA